MKINDDLYVYSRVECEFSGVQTLHVFDANRAEQVGVRLGFDSREKAEAFIVEFRKAHEPSVYCGPPVEEPKTCCGKPMEFCPDCAKEYEAWLDTVQAVEPLKLAEAK